MHAYMIIAHRQFDLLAKLITALDDERNDIFVHIDAKVRDFDFEKFKITRLAPEYRILCTSSIRLIFPAAITGISDA